MSSRKGQRDGYNRVPLRGWEKVRKPWEVGMGLDEWAMARWMTGGSAEAERWVLSIASSASAKGDGVGRGVVGRREGTSDHMGEKRIRVVAVIGPT
jgi:hypothetical protein